MRMNMGSEQDRTEIAQMAVVYKLRSVIVHHFTPYFLGVIYLRIEQRCLFRASRPISETQYNFTMVH
jgi:hypothetical protein